MRSPSFRRSSKPTRHRSGSWLSMARIAGEILSLSPLAIRSHSASTRLLSALSKDLPRSPCQEPEESADLSTVGRSVGGHFRWYSLHIQRDSDSFSCHSSETASSSAATRRAATDSSLETFTRNSE